MRYYIFLAISIVLNSASLILLKKGALVAKNDGLILRDPGTWLQLLGNLHIYLSLTAFALATITWLFALTKIDLSVAYPSVSISYIIIAIASIRKPPLPQQPSNTKGIFCDILFVFLKITFRFAASTI